jgi:hypothetical protein
MWRICPELFPFVPAPCHSLFQILVGISRNMTLRYLKNLSLFILSFCQGCLCAHLGNVLSAPYWQKNGMLQGSVLNLTLFAIAVSETVSVVGLS